MYLKVTGTERWIVDFNRKYEVDENTKIDLKGEFRSIGTEKSKIYFGLHCYKEDGTEIIGEDVYRTNESRTIESYDSNSKTLILDKKPETWDNYDYSISLQQRKCIGFYFDGKIDHLPDYFIDTPAYDKYVDNNIVLKKEIPSNLLDKIIPSITKVMNHYHSNTRDYSAACDNTVPETWTEFKATYEGFSEIGDIKGKFRLGTKKVSPFVYPNYHQNNNAVLEIRNVEIKVMEKLKNI